MKLYLVKLRGMQYAATGTVYGRSYVVAHSPSEAYNIVKNYLYKNDIGFIDDRELDLVQLLAEESGDPLCNTCLFIQHDDSDGINKYSVKRLNK